jgi:hypothetical protein
MRLSRPAIEVLWAAMRCSSRSHAPADSIAAGTSEMAAA